MNDELDNWRTLMEKGTAKLGQAEYIRAENYFRRSLRVANQLDAPVIKAFTLRLLATAQVKQGKIEAAERGFREALGICEGVSNLKGIAEAYAGLASVSVETQDLETAVLLFKKALQAYPPTSPKLRLAMLYSDLGQVYAALERWQEARDTYEYARELCHNYGYSKGEGELSVLIGEACFRQGDKIAAQVFIKSSCQIFALIKEQTSLINALQYYAFINYEQQKFEDAREALQRAVALQIHCSSPEELSESSYFLAKIFQSQEQLDEAQYYLELSIKHKQDKSLGLALRVQSLAKLKSLKQDFITAKKLFMECATLFESFGDDPRQGECYEHLAFLADCLGEESEAEYYRKEAIRTLAGFNATSLSAVQRLAEYYERRRSYMDALQCYWQALQIAREIGYEAYELEKAVQRVSRRVRSKKH